MKGDVGTHHVKEWRQEVPLAILSRIVAQSCTTPCLSKSREGLRMIVLVSLIVVLRELLVSTLSHCASPDMPRSTFENAGHFYSPR